MLNINKFLKKLFLFLFIPAAALILLVCFFSYKTDKFIDNFTIPKNVSALLIGDSHIVLGLNDAIIPNSLNISQVSESYYFTYFKLDRLLRSNLSVKKIYLGFGYHNLSNYYDNVLFGKNSKDVAPKYLFILPRKEQYKILKSNLSNTTVFAKNLIMNGIISNLFGRYDLGFLGKFDNVMTYKKATKSLMDKRLLNQFYSDNKLDGFSELNLTYLDHIITQCKEKQIELILVNTPLHPYYKSRIPNEYLQKYTEVLKKYQLKLLDFSGVVFDDDCFTPDGDHVTQKGAAIASEFIATHP